MTASTRRFALLLVLVALAGTGCLGRTPNVRYYALASLPDATPAGTRAATGLAVEVGPLTLPRPLERPQIVRRAADSELEYDEFHRWAASLDSELLRVLGDDLGTLLGSSRVVVYPADAPFPLDYRVRIDVQQLDGALGGEVVLRARWVVAPGAGGEAVAAEQTTVREPTEGVDHATFVAAHGRAVGALARAIADRLTAHRRSAR